MPKVELPPTRTAAQGEKIVCSRPCRSGEATPEAYLTPLLTPETPLASDTPALSLAKKAIIPHNRAVTSLLED